ncbi:MAG: ribosome-associated translation inhibitor RaiA [Acidobacteriota bacterium]|jgi:putative sigma-54 modulation protein
MNIEYVGRNYSVDDSVRGYVEGKLGKKLVKFIHEPVEIRVTLETEKHRNIADVHITHKNGVLQATEETGDMYDAINMAVDKVEKQARRSKKKSIDRRRRADRETTNGQRWPLEVLSRESFAAGGERRIIKTTHLPIKPMTIEEAALQLETAKNEFLVFRNSATDRVNVLYKRRDENYGLIAPEL